MSNLGLCPKFCPNTKNTQSWVWAYLNPNSSGAHYVGPLGPFYTTRTCWHKRDWALAPFAFLRACIHTHIWCIRNVYSPLMDFLEFVINSRPCNFSPSTPNELMLLRKFDSMRRWSPMDSGGVTWIRVKWKWGGHV